MSGAGSPISGIIPLVAPDLYQQQLQAQRRRAYAQALLEQGMSSGQGKYGGLKSAANSLIGAFLSKQQDKGDMDIAAQERAALFGGGSPAQSDSAAPAMGGAGGGAMGGSGSGILPQSAGAGPSQPQQGGGGGIIDMLVPNIPGMPPIPQQQKMMILAEPQNYAAYLKASLDAGAPTDAIKNINAAYGAGTDQSHQAIQAYAQSQRMQNVRQGSVLVDPMNPGQSLSNPNSSGVATAFNQQGNPVQFMAQGAPQAQAQSAFVGGLGAAAAKPGTLFDAASNTYPLGSQAQQAGLGGVAQSLGIPQGGSAPAGAMQQPGMGAPAAPNVSRETSPPMAPQGPLQSAPPLGSPEFNAATGKAAGSATTDLRALASDVPTRLNVLQSILDLSKIAQTGTPEALQDAREHLAGILQATMGVRVNPTDQAAINTEIHKYMEQYALRLAQTQGGTGTDQQLKAVEAANPNDAMFPATLQRVVPWIMANERGIAAKANAQDAYLAQAGQNPAAQQHFEHFWRNNYDPRIAQMESMTPQQIRGFLTDPHAFPGGAAERNALIAKFKALHPFFQTGAPQ